MSTANNEKGLGVNLLKWICFWEVWWFVCRLNQDSQDYKIFRMLKF